MAIRNRTRRWIVCFMILAACTTMTSASQRRRRKPSQPTRATQEDDNYYAILGLTKKAKKKEIKSAYRKLALKYHPDKVAEEEKEAAEEKFIKVSEAYAVLSDDEKRKIYDQFGKQGLDAAESGQDPRNAGFGGGGGGQHHFHFNGGGGAGGFDPFSMFEEFFAQGAGGGGFPGGGFQSGGGFQGGFPGGGFGGGGFPGGFPGGGGGGGGFPGGGGGGFANGGGRRQQPPPQDLFPKDHPTVAKLGSPKFPNASSKHLWMVVFYDNNDPENQQVKPMIEKLAEKSSFKVGALDCSKSPKEIQFCEQKGVENVPSYAFVVGKDLKFYEESDPSAKDLHEFAMKSMPTHLVHNINHPHQVEERLLQKQGQKSILLLSDKYETSSLYFGLAYRHRKDFIFGESRAKNLNLAKIFSVKKYPLLVALVPPGLGDEKLSDAADIVRYSGEMKSEKISKWIDSVAKWTNNRRSRPNRNDYGL